MSQHYLSAVWYTSDMWCPVLYYGGHPSLLTLIASIGPMAAPLVRMKGCFHRIVVGLAFFADHPTPIQGMCAPLDLFHDPIVGLGYQLLLLSTQQVGYYRGLIEIMENATWL